ncbi:cytochrome c oxidase subunit 6b-1 [Dendrobium catenatum]|uniref:Cytochrome c oxidase subunit 6b-1 n=1 Tax=Dendrobium catenatum TaxID=906689 RepID=A0A2I0W462_9ASPA|nr:cytochrome c oxidase subunit 6b-1 [Dendrobium catenatum]PKU70443.1 Cytochrome c oxidase subunit 6b-1 [Dendrobium catenatum]
MAETEQKKKITGLSEEWLLVEKYEQDDRSNTSEQATGESVAEKIDQTAVTEENAPNTGEEEKTPELEATLTKEEEKQEVKEDSVTPEQNAEPSQEVEEKSEPVETASAAEENSANPIPETDQAQEVEENEEAKEETPIIKLETAPADFRFPTTNQTRHCFTRYIEYHRCIEAKGEGAPECQKFAKYYRSLCPGEWIERWNEQRENGTFPGPL